MRTTKREQENLLRLKDLRRMKKAKGLCAWAGCETPVSTRPMFSQRAVLKQNYTHCDVHRKYFRETMRERKRLR